MELIIRNYDYDQYVATKHFLREKIEEDFGFALNHLKRCDQLILESVQDVVAGDALAAALHAHSLYLAACDLARAGHLSALFLLLELQWSPRYTATFSCGKKALARRGASSTILKRISQVRKQLSRKLWRALESFCRSTIRIPGALHMKNISWASMMQLSTMERTQIQLH